MSYNFSPFPISIHTHRNKNKSGIQRKLRMRSVAIVNFLRAFCDKWGIWGGGGGGEEGGRKKGGVRFKKIKIKKMPKSPLAAARATAAGRCKKKFLKASWRLCYYPHRSRDSLSPVCGIFSTVTTFSTFSTFLPFPFCSTFSTISTFSTFLLINFSTCVLFYCLLFNVYFRLTTVNCLPSIVYWLWCTVYCLLSTDQPGPGLTLMVCPSLEPWLVILTSLVKAYDQPNNQPTHQIQSLSRSFWSMVCFRLYLEFANCTIGSKVMLITSCGL